MKEGVYPYEDIDDVEKLKENNSRPSKPSIQNSDSRVSQKMNTSTPRTYIITSTVKAFKTTTTYIWNRTFYCYQPFCISEKTSIEHYKLDPANFITAASYAWSCMLLRTGIELELITDPKILDIFERSKRGGLTFVSSIDTQRPNNEINLSNVFRR